MRAYQCDFIRFAIKYGVLCFGEFTLKSGRTGPYFFSANPLDGGLALARPGRFYAEAVIDSGIDFDILFGPVYKDIPPAAATAMILTEQHQRDLPWCFDREEAKDHDKGDTLVDASLNGRVLIIDGVTTVGAVIHEVMQITDAQGARAAGVLIVLNRQEHGKGEPSAIQEVGRDFGIPVVNIVSPEQVLGYFVEDAELKKHLLAVEAYRTQHGIWTFHKGLTWSDRVQCVA